MISHHAAARSSAIRRSFTGVLFLKSLQRSRRPRICFSALRVFFSHFTGSGQYLNARSKHRRHAVYRAPARDDSRHEKYARRGNTTLLIVVAAVCPLRDVAKLCATGVRR